MQGIPTEIYGPAETQIFEQVARQTQHGAQAQVYLL